MQKIIATWNTNFNFDYVVYLCKLENRKFIWIQGEVEHKVTNYEGYTMSELIQNEQAVQTQNFKEVYLFLRDVINDKKPPDWPKMELVEEECCRCNKIKDIGASCWWCGC